MTDPSLVHATSISACEWGVTDVASSERPIQSRESLDLRVAIIFERSEVAPRRKREVESKLICRASPLGSVTSQTWSMPSADSRPFAMIPLLSGSQCRPPTEFHLNSVSGRSAPVTKSSSMIAKSRSRLGNFPAAYAIELPCGAQTTETMLRPFGMVSTTFSPVPSELATAIELTPSLNRTNANFPPSGEKDPAACTLERIFVDVPPRIEILLK